MKIPESVTDTAQLINQSKQAVEKYKQLKYQWEEGLISQELFLQQLDVVECNLNTLRDKLLQQIQKIEQEIKCQNS